MLPYSWLPLTRTCGSWDRFQLFPAQPQSILHVYSQFRITAIYYKRSKWIGEGSRLGTRDQVELNRTWFCVHTIHTCFEPLHLWFPPKLAEVEGGQKSLDCDCIKQHNAFQWPHLSQESRGVCGWGRGEGGGGVTLVPLQEEAPAGGHLGTPALGTLVYSMSDV